MKTVSNCVLARSEDNYISMSSIHFLNSLCLWEEPALIFCDIAHVKVEVIRVQEI